MSDSSTSSKPLANEIQSFNEFIQRFKYPIIATIIAIIPFLFALSPCPNNFKKHQFTCKLNDCESKCNGGGCRYDPVNHKFSCVCKIHFEGQYCENCEEGYLYQSDTKDCELKSCVNGKYQNGKCICKDNYSGDYCENCKGQIYQNKCILNIVCNEKQKQVFSGGQFSCQCNNGFTGNKCQKCEKGKVVVDNICVQK
ncbi:Cysteine-rich membrane protein 2 [Spironucleus salmonicida]|uniref:Cysteine-rich membrane protein 2 n=1 Tax=Spironucleus salmonicida TaxID=348837 RepID=V6LKV9_9EUKA|nr:Cysteine-rich membrane protein 2 [Spironucleus salmonicida]|eukprot:EST41314.1 Cysteine-rich membrane protein 2 [Spironucleus salmonicida]